MNMPRGVRPRRHCGHKVIMRVQRARLAHQEMSAEGAVARLLAIFAAMVSSMPLVPSPSRVSSEVSVSPVSSPRVRTLRPPLTLDEAMRHIRGARYMTPRVRNALDLLKQSAPSASDWIEQRANWLEWSDLTRCLVVGNEEATVARLQRAADVWRESIRPKINQDVDDLTFRP